MAVKTSKQLAFAYVQQKLRLIATVSPAKAAEKAFDLFCTPQKKPAKPPSPIVQQAERLSLQFSTGKIHGYRWNKGAGKKLLIVHGFESSAQNFEGFVAPLINKGYEIIAFDAPAHGASEGKIIMLPIYIAMLHAVHAAYGPFDAYISHSLGGLALMHFLPHIPHSDKTKVVLIAPAAEVVAVMDRFFRLLKLNASVRKEFDILCAERTGMTPQQASIAEVIPHIHANILWLHDTEDDVTPFADAEKIKKMQLPNIEFVITNGLGHRKIYRDETNVERIVHFL